MARLVILGATVTCDEHDDAILVYRAILGKCPFCALEEQLEDSRQLVKGIQEDLALEGERLKTKRVEE